MKPPLFVPDLIQLLRLPRRYPAVGSDGPPGLQPRGLVTILQKEGNNKRNMSYNKYATETIALRRFFLILYDFVPMLNDIFEYAKDQFSESPVLGLGLTYER
jgi:hypothetical protein